jgi:hypothetical protein
MEHNVGCNVGKRHYVWRQIRGTHLGRQRYGYGCAWTCANFIESRTKAVQVGRSAVLRLAQTLKQYFLGVDEWARVLMEIRNYGSIVVLAPGFGTKCWTAETTIP